MFEKKKAVEPVNMQPVRVVEKTLIEKLRERRLEKVAAANELDRDIAELDAEITWIERNPTFNGIMRELALKYEGL